MNLDDFMCKEPEKYNAFKMVFYGAMGCGKSTLASTFKKPFFIRTEAGLRSIPIENKSIIISESNQILQIIKALKDGLLSKKYDYKTIVLDNISGVDMLLISEVTSESTETSSSGKPLGFNAIHGGYSNATSMVEQRHESIVRALDNLQKECGVNVIYIGHELQTEKECIEKVGKFIHCGLDYTARKDRKHVYCSSAEIVARITVPMRTVLGGGTDKSGKEKSGRIVTESTKYRILDCSPQLNQETKNNIGISEPIEYFEGENPLIEIIKSKILQENKSKEKKEGK